MTIRDTIRVLLVDDHSIVRTGLRYFLMGVEDITSTPAATTMS